jgi:hypothetical protein
VKEQTRCRLLQFINIILQLMRFNYSASFPGQEKDAAEADWNVWKISQVNDTFYGGHIYISNKNLDFQFNINLIFTLLFYILVSYLLSFYCACLWFSYFVENSALRMESNGTNVFCFLVFFTPSPSRHYGSVWVLPVIPLLLTNTVLPVRAFLSIWLERFRGTQKEDECGPLTVVFSPLWWSPCNWTFVVP